MKKGIIVFLSLCLAFCCVSCKDSAKHECSYTQTVTNEEYKASEATCQKSAEYFYSCKCGKRGNGKFSHGARADHIYQDDKCIYCQREPFATETNKSLCVYITPTGIRYHYLSTCAGKNAKPITKNDAIRLGYTGCKKCTRQRGNISLKNLTMVKF